MDEKRHQQNTSSGFLFGVIIGVILTLLFTTKKGRQVLRMLTDEGLNKFADLEDILQDKMQHEEEPENADYLAPEERIVEPEPAEVTEEVHTVSEVKEDTVAVEKKTADTAALPTATQTKSSAKHFFRKSSKK